MTFIKDQMKNELEEVICRNAIKAVNKEINATLRTIPGEERMFNDTLKTNYDLVRPPQFLHNGVESDFKGEFLNVKHPKTPPYTPEELPPIRDEHSKMVYIWVTAYTINTAFFAVNQSGLQFLFDNDNLPDGAPVELNTNAFMLVVPTLYSKYPNKDMAIRYCSSAPAKITLNPDDASVTLFGLMTFYVILDDNKLVDCFTLNMVEVANIDDILIFRKGSYSYFGLKLTSSRTDVTLQESHIGDFDLTLLRFTVDILAQFILSRYISPKMEEGFKLPLPKNVVLANSETAIGKNYILIFTDFGMQMAL
ncbi:Bactericidal permeability-increasing [Paramuricea clavata]|uniref:Bactericidal permeability-increasing, partial n=1 Tax=Paramuricea clavata TaxID=317549 RepID=A0A6S7HCA1_PARCT|nr:Bactericidal permeability-increasing [Paramuricea clavata]